MKLSVHVRRVLYWFLLLSLFSMVFLIASKVLIVATLVADYSKFEVTSVRACVRGHAPCHALSRSQGEGYVVMVVGGE